MSFVQTPNGTSVERESYWFASTATHEYYGFHDPGASKTTATTSIMRVNKTTSDMEWANGGRYASVWNDYLTETYET